MVFRVEISPQAFSDLDDIAGYITDRGGFEGAQRWFNEIMGAIRTLQKLPGRCPIAEESNVIGTEVRLLLHGRRGRSYRIYFAIDHEKATVRVFHVRHWARKALDADELEDLREER